MLNKGVTAIIIDDEIAFSSSLKILLNKNFPQVKILGVAGSVAEAVELINTLEPGLIFLDINLPDGTGFDVLEKTDHSSYRTIFTTAHTEFAIRAFEFSALHYLLKPLTLEMLTDAMMRIPKESNEDLFEEKLQLLMDGLVNKPKKIMLYTPSGNTICNIEDIVRCEANDNYTDIYLRDKAMFTISRTLQEMTKKLHELNFIRIHKRHLVNLHYVKKYNSGNQPFLTLEDDTIIPLSLTYKNEFKERFKQFVKPL